ncbi:hypothetical protein LVJ94_02940 [Pendulispora rubella]|uniref:Uncharacterized protein n=1 Tax=Pendulispora rubella TaxID=2741070 RepID=A0ABZ2L5H8_9BACT
MNSTFGAVIRKVSCGLLVTAAIGPVACNFGLDNDDDCDSEYIPGTWSPSGGASVVRDDGTVVDGHLSFDARQLGGVGTFTLDSNDGRGCNRPPASGDTNNGGGGFGDAGRADASRDAATDARATDSGAGSTCQEYKYSWLLITWTDGPGALFDVWVCPTSDAWFAADDYDAKGHPQSCRDTRSIRTPVTHRSVRGLADRSTNRLRLLANTHDVNIDASASYVSGPPMSNCYGH